MTLSRDMSGHRHTEPFHAGAAVLTILVVVLLAPLVLVAGLAAWIYRRLRGRS